LVISYTLCDFPQLSSLAKFAGVRECVLIGPAQLCSQLLAGKELSGCNFSDETKSLI
jgi:hypothetical protein